MLGQNSVQETRFKVNVNMTPIEGYSLSKVNWEAKVFTENGLRWVTVPKEEAIMVDDDNYLIPIDSAVLGAGKYYITLRAEIPDSDFADGIRIEKRTGFTGVTIDAR